MQAISLSWLVFNTVPHITLLFNSAFGPGAFMVAWCRFGMFLTFASGALAIILMWLLYPRAVDFTPALLGSVTFLQVCAHATIVSAAGQPTGVSATGVSATGVSAAVHGQVPRQWSGAAAAGDFTRHHGTAPGCRAERVQRHDPDKIDTITTHRFSPCHKIPAAVQSEFSGMIPADFPEDVTTWRSDSGLQYERARIAANGGVKNRFNQQSALPGFNVTRDLSGGFYEDGEYGPVKLTKTNALSMSTLAWAMLDARSSFTADQTFLVRCCLALCLAACAACAASAPPARALPCSCLALCMLPDKDQVSHHVDARVGHARRPVELHCRPCVAALLCACGVCGVCCVSCFGDADACQR